MGRHVVLSVSRGGTTKIQLSSDVYTSFILKNVGTMLKESKFKHLTKRD